MADVLKYGDKVHLQNGYASWKGGYLDTNGHATDSGAKYGVSTASTPTRGALTGTWEIISAEGKAAGTQVLSGDLIHLRNLYGNDGGYLDTNGHATAEQKTAAAKFNVLTATTKDRAGQATGSWRIFAQTSAPTDQAVRENDIIHLWNAYGSNGGFLETNGLGPAGGEYDVCTNAYLSRAENVGLWKLMKATS